MSAAMLDGAKLARAIKESLKPRIEAVAKARGRPPALLILASDDKDRPSKSYRQTQMKACIELGVRVQLVESRWPNSRAVLDTLERMPDFDGVIFDLPLPKSVDLDALLTQVPCQRDAEGVTAGAFGRLLQAHSFAEIEHKRLAAPCTALAVAELVRASGVPLAGKTAVVLGRSNIVGKPAAHLLSCLDLTVTLCHSKTRDLAQIISQADVLVAALGKAKFVKAGWIKKGAVVIDAGINEDNGSLCGDVDPAAAERAGFLTPVPGGVGPVTNALLLANTVALAERARAESHGR